jgi:endonuclease G, mitochondrial
MKSLRIFTLLVALCSMSFAQDLSYKTNLMIYSGTPQVHEPHEILYNDAFIVAYSEKYKAPLWVAYRTGNRKSKNDHQHYKWERPPRFIVDNRTEAKVTHDDYTSSGYQRGHMAPNALMYDQYGHMAQLETYLMSNVIPQTAKLNTGLWLKLETKVRTEISQDDTRNKEINQVFVITGPIFDKETPDTIGNGVAVPTRCFKILAYRRGYRGTVKTVAFIFPQVPTKDSIWDYVVTVDEIEEATGIDFYPELTKRKQKNLESKKRNFKLEDLE